MYKIKALFNWRGLPFILFAISLIFIILIYNQKQEISKLNTSIDLSKEELSTQIQNQEELKQVTVKDHEVVIKQRNVSAQKIATEIIDVENKLAAFYKTNESLPTDEAKVSRILEALNRVKIENTKLTNAKESDHIQTWKLNPAWTIRLTSIVTYQDTDMIPMLFTMTLNKKGDIQGVAGLIYATYDVQQHKLLNISRHYTLKGLADEIDVGGA